MIKHDEVYVLDKTVWTEADFDQMGWHDACVHGISWDTDTHSFLLDIDYIYQWVAPKEGRGSFSFWISPCTLVFNTVWSVDISVKMSNELYVMDIVREQTRHATTGDLVTGVWDWIIECDSGEMSFTSNGFTQYSRQEPKHISAQKFDLTERGGVKFDLVIIPENTNMAS